MDDARNDRTSDRTGERGSPRVRPRLVWLGLGLGLLAAVGAGVAVSLAAWWWLVPAGVVALVGLALGLRGRIQDDAAVSASLSRQAEAVQEDETIEGVHPGQMVRDPEVEQHALEAHEAHDRVQRQRATQTQRPGLSTMGIHLVLAVGLLVLVAQWTIYPHTAVGQGNGLRDLGCGILASLGALYMRQVAPSRVADGVVLLAGVLMLFLGLVEPHDRGFVEGMELVLGGLIVLGALMAADTKNGGNMTSVHPS